MNDTIETPAATKKAPAKKAPAKAVPQKAEAKEAVKTAYRAEGRSGQVTTQTSTQEMKFAVDVQRDGRANYQAGVIARFFSDESKAQAFVDAVNSGEMGKKDSWYETARNAIIVKAEVVK